MENMGMYFEMDGHQPSVLQARFYSFPVVPKQILQQLNLEVWDHPGLTPARRFLDTARKYLLLETYAKDIEELERLAGRQLSGKLAPDLPMLRRDLSIKMAECLAALPETEEIKAFKELFNDTLSDEEATIGTALIQMAFASALDTGPNPANW